jgi:hypothetical protein
MDFLYFPNISRQTIAFIGGQVYVIESGKLKTEIPVSMRGSGCNWKSPGNGRARIGTHQRDL